MLNQAITPIDYIIKILPHINIRILILDRMKRSLYDNFEKENTTNRTAKGGV
jgi:hypothetical protein